MIAAVVRWLAERVRAGEPTCLQAVFDVAETCLASGTGETRTLIMVGLFEDLQSNLLTGDIDWKVRERHLRPLSRSGWQAIARFWQGDMKALPRLFAKHHWEPSDRTPDVGLLARLRAKFEKPRG